MDFKPVQHKQQIKFKILFKFFLNVGFDANVHCMHLLILVPSCSCHEATTDESPYKRVLLNVLAVTHLNIQQAWSRISIYLEQ